MTELIVKFKHFGIDAILMYFFDSFEPRVRTIMDYVEKPEVQIILLIVRIFISIK